MAAISGADRLAEELAFVVGAQLTDVLIHIKSIGLIGVTRGVR
jgi:hypothetical protein